MPIISSKDIFLSLVEGFLTLWKMWLIIGIVIIIKFSFRLLEKQRLSKSGIAEIDRMDGLTFEQSSIDLNVCTVCGKPVSQKIKQYCLSNQQRFKGKVFCFERQREIKMYTSSNKTS